MIVAHNLSSINAERHYKSNKNRLSKSLEKLSSGYKINRAGDNAAGLAVSEKMRSQIKGIDQAVYNAKDGISMVQTFEGALSETHTILHRIKTLATQSANGIYDDQVDRAAIELEYEELIAELDDIAGTDFNGKVVMNSDKYDPFSYFQNVTKLPHPDDPTGFPEFPLYRTEIVKILDYAIYPPPETGEWAIEQYDSQKNGNLIATANLGRLDDPAAAERGFTLTDPSGRYNMGTISGAGLVEIAKSGGASMDYGLESFRPLLKLLDDGSVKIEQDKTYNSPEGWNEQQKLLNEMNGTSDPLPYAGFSGSERGGVSLQVGARTKDLKIYDFDYSDVYLSKEDEKKALGSLTSDINATAKGLGLLTSMVNLASQTKANAALDKIDNAINKVSMIRATFGSIQNRLEHKVDNLNQTNESLTASESRIRDTDIASEMMFFSRDQILLQASGAMLSQANGLPQGVLSLLS
jgi:flagellin